jgi:hypothetical protein
VLCDVLGAQRGELDSIISMIAAQVDLSATIAPTQDFHSAARALIHDIPSSAQHLESGQLPLRHRGGPREGLASMCAAAVDRAVHMRDALSTETPQKAWEGLCRVRAEGLKLLAEFTALSIQHMAFLAMCLEGGDAEAAGLQFLQGAAFLRCLHDLSTLQVAFAMYQFPMQQLNISSCLLLFLLS